jgi:hypothetical protein
LVAFATPPTFFGPARPCAGYGKRNPMAQWRDESSFVMLAPGIRPGAASADLAVEQSRRILPGDRLLGARDKTSAARRAFHA